MLLIDLFGVIGARYTAKSFEAIVRTVFSKYTPADPFQLQHREPSSLRRRVPHVLLRVLGEGDVGVLVVEGAVLGQDVLLVVPLEALAQLHVGDGVATLRVGDHLSINKGMSILSKSTSPGTVLQRSCSMRHLQRRQINEP